MISEYGLREIEVSDDGTGIRETDFENIAKSHWTSKLHSFEDIAKITSFGFRGEALSALAALGDLFVLTAARGSAETGYRLTYDANGVLKSKEKAARNGGTTVTVKNLFARMPVRVKVDTSFS